MIFDSDAGVTRELVGCAVVLWFVVRFIRPAHAEVARVDVPHTIGVFALQAGISLNDDLTHGTGGGNGKLPLFVSQDQPAAKEIEGEVAGGDPIQHQCMPVCHDRVAHTCGKINCGVAEGHIGIQHNAAAVDSKGPALNGHIFVNDPGGVCSIRCADRNQSGALNGVPV